MSWNILGTDCICRVFLPYGFSDVGLDDFVGETFLGIEHIEMAFL